MQHGIEINRHGDGSIDMDHYIARGRSMHGQAVRAVAKSLWRVLGARISRQRKALGAAGQDLPELATAE